MSIYGQQAAPADVEEVFAYHLSKSHTALLIFADS